VLSKEMQSQLSKSLRRIGVKSYKIYLQSDHWAGVVEKLKREKCQVCGSKKALHLHHRNYICLGKEKQCDLLTLCAACHLLEHGRLLEDEKGKPEKAKKKAKEKKQRIPDVAEKRNQAFELRELKRRLEFQKYQSKKESK